MTTTQDPQGRVQETTSTAREEGQHLGKVGVEEVQNVASEATDHLRGLADETMAQVREQSGQQKDRLTATLRSVGDELDEMRSGSQTHGVASSLVTQAASLSRQVSDHLESREPAELLEEVRDFARRRPGLFLGGAVIAGIAAGRLTRGLKTHVTPSAADRSGLDTTGAAPVPMPVVETPGAALGSTGLPDQRPEIGVHYGNGSAPQPGPTL